MRAGACFSKVPVANRPGKLFCVCCIYIQDHTFNNFDNDTMKLSVNETKWIDLLQVDLLASGASLFWPRSGRPRATKSREVDLSRLQGFHSHFAPKWGVA